MKVCKFKQEGPHRDLRCEVVARDGKQCDREGTWLVWGPNVAEQYCCEAHKNLLQGPDLLVHAFQLHDGLSAERHFTLAQARCSTGGWSADIAPTPDEIGRAEKRWALRSYRDDARAADPDCEYQCGGCRFFAATGSDYGICWNEHSPMDGLVVFEHGGCLQHSERSCANPG